MMSLCSEILANHGKGDDFTGIYFNEQLPFISATQDKSDDYYRPPRTFPIFQFNDKSNNCIHLLNIYFHFSLMTNTCTEHTTKLTTRFSSGHLWRATWWLLHAGGRLKTDPLTDWKPAGTGCRLTVRSCPENHPPSLHPTPPPLVHDVW